MTVIKLLFHSRLSQCFQLNGAYFLEVFFLKKILREQHLLNEVNFDCAAFLPLQKGKAGGRGEINNSVVKLNLFQKGWRKV